jgi:hypothetical protein
MMENTIYAPGGIVQGVGKIIRANGEVVEFTLTSDPLTEEQADKLNQDQAQSAEGV